MKAQIITFLFLVGMTALAKCPYEQFLNGPRRVRFSETFVKTIDLKLQNVETDLRLRARGTPTRNPYNLSRSQLEKHREFLSGLITMREGVDQLRPSVVGFHPELEKIHDALVLATETVGTKVLNELGRGNEPSRDIVEALSHVQKMAQEFANVRGDNNLEWEGNLREKFGENNLAKIAETFATAIHEGERMERVQQKLHSVDSFDSKKSMELAARYETTVLDIQSRWADINRPNVVPVHVRFRKRKFSNEQAVALLMASLDLGVPPRELISGLNAATRRYFFKLNTDPAQYLSPQTIEAFARVSAESKTPNGLNLSFREVAKFYFQTGPPKILDPVRLEFVEKFGDIGPRAFSLEKGELPPENVVSAWKRDSFGLFTYEARWRVYRLNRRQWARARRLSQNSR